MLLYLKLTEMKASPRRHAKGVEAIARLDRNPLARNTVRNIHATLRAMLKAAVEDGVILSNPAEKLGRQLRLVTSNVARQEKIKAMRREQRQLFLHTAAQMDLRYYPLFFTLAGTGMQLGEAIGLEWPHVDVLEGNSDCEGHVRR